MKWSLPCRHCDLIFNVANSLNRCALPQEQNATCLRLQCPFCGHEAAYSAEDVLRGADEGFHLLAREASTQA